MRLLAEGYPEVPLVALGQTVLWDEPMKAVLWASLREAGLCARLVFGVHDTDYFAKPPIAPDSPGSYQILTHNDGSTKDLWVAMGELSRLFGAEAHPSREELAAHGVPVEKMARNAPEGRDRWVDRVTEAFGWRGLAYTGSRRMLAADVRLRDCLSPLLELLRWGFDETIGSLVEERDRERARRQADSLLEVVESFARTSPDATLSELFQHLLPYLLESMLGSPAHCARFTCSREMFRFNRGTAGLPRFEPLGLFLDPSTRDAARGAYDDAVRGSEIYTLDRFGPGSIPFDLVVPGHGRGTLRILPGKVVVQADEPLYLRCEKPVTSTQELAELVEQHLGPDVSLVGKAVVLITMTCREAVGVFSATGSGYIWRTRRFSDGLRARGISLPLYPILRLKYPTWDSLGAVEGPLRLPSHLARAFGKETLSGRELASRWRAVVAEQKQRLAEIAQIKSPRDLMAYLAVAAPNGWQERLERFSQDQDHLLCVRERIQALKEETQRLYVELREAKRELQAIDRAKGEDFRATILPLKECLWHLTQAQPVDEAACAEVRQQIREHEERRKEFDTRWADARARAKALQDRVREVRASRRALEMAPETTAVRARLSEAARVAEEARLELVRDALLTTRGLERGDFRPSAWWFLLVSPDGAWFREVQRGTRGYLEPLSAEEPQRAPFARCAC